MWWLTHLEYTKIIIALTSRTGQSVQILHKAVDSLQWLSIGGLEDAEGKNRPVDLDHEVILVAGVKKASQTGGQRAHDREPSEIELLTEHINADDGLIELRIRAPRNIVVQALLITESIDTLEDEFKKRVQVFWPGTCNEIFDYP